MKNFKLKKDNKKMANEKNKMIGFRATDIEKEFVEILTKHYFKDSDSKPYISDFLKSLIDEYAVKYFKEKGGKNNER